MWVTINIVKKFVSVVISIFIFTLLGFSISNIALAQDDNIQPEPIQEDRLEATVTKILEEKEIIPEYGQDKQLYQKLELSITKGSIEGETITIESGTIPSVNLQKYKAGDQLIVVASKDFEGNDAFYIDDYIRRGALLWLFLIFVILAIAIGKWWGFASILGMGYSFLVIFQFILPRLLSGSDPVTTAILGSTLIIPVTFYLSHGLNKKTTVAIVGTVISLIITGILASIFVNAAKLTGFASEEAGFLQVVRQGTINIQGLLLAGIIIGTLGILDDVTVSQSSIVNQLRITDKNLSLKDLYSKAMSVGRDHISSMVNTLVLVYTGAALPLLLLFYDNPLSFSDVINYEIIATEIVIILVGSIGLMAAVPITTLIAAMTIEKR